MTLLNVLNRSWGATFLINILLIALYLLPYLFLDNPISNLEVSVFGIPIVAGVPVWIVVIMQLVVAMAFFLWASVFLFSKYTDIISYLQFSLMMMLMVCWQSVQLIGEQTVATVFAFVALLQIINIDSTRDNTSNVLNSLILLILASVFRVDFMWLLPIFFIGIFVLEVGVRVKSIVLVLFTTVVAMGTLMGVAYLTGNTEHVTRYYANIFNLNCVQYSVIYLVNNIVFFLSIIFFAVSVLLYWQTHNRFRLKTKRTITFVVLIWFFLTLYMLMFDGGIEAFSFLHLMLTSLFVSLNFVDYHSQFKNKIFLTFIILLIISYIIRFANNLSFLL